MKRDARGCGISLLAGMVLSAVFMVAKYVEDPHNARFRGNLVPIAVLWAYLAIAGALFWREERKTWTSTVTLAAAALIAGSVLHAVGGMDVLTATVTSGMLFLIGRFLEHV